LEVFIKPRVIEVRLLVFKVFHWAPQEISFDTWRIDMKALLRVGAIFLCIGLIFVAPASAGPKKNRSSVSKTTQRIIVFARKTDHGIEYRINKQIYTGKDLCYVLGELHIYANTESAIAVVLEDNMFLSDVKNVPAMALKAGYTDVRAYVYWKRTGRMAEILFGPVLKATADPRKP